MEAVSWHVITGEYPPARGGVADYTRALASALASAGDDVHIWSPAVDGGLVSDPGVQLHPLPEGYRPSGLRRLSRELRRLPGRKRILVQYVPHAFGMRAMNIPFCGWLAALREAEVWIMFHEVALPWGRARRWRANAASAVTRVMANLLVARADRVFLSIPSWRPILRDIAPFWHGKSTGFRSPPMFRSRPPRLRGRASGRVCSTCRRGRGSLVISARVAP